MKLITKIGIGLVILVLCLAGLASLSSTPQTPTQITPTPENDELSPPSNIIHGKTNKEVVIGNSGITVSPPIYNKTVYQEQHGKFVTDDYTAYHSRKGYHFAIIKIKVFNYGKEQHDPYLDDVILQTKNDLKYEEGTHYNFTIEYFSTPPKPLAEEICSLSPVLPKDSIEPYICFEIPKKAKVDEVHFNYTLLDKIVEEKEVSIKI